MVTFLGSKIGGLLLEWGQLDASPIGLDKLQHFFQYFGI